MQVIINKKVTQDIKGIAICMVIIGHISSIYEPSLLNYFGAFGVSLFLMLSGYGLAISYEKNKLTNFFKKRISKVWIPYVCITSIWIIVDLCKGIYYPLKSYALLFAGFDGNRSIDATMWYISFILLWYVLFYVIYRVVDNHLVSFVFLYCMGYIFIGLKNGGVMVNLSWQWGLHAFSFSLGILLFIFKERITRKVLVSINLLSFVIMITWINRIQESIEIYRNVNMVVAVFIITLMMLINTIVDAETVLGKIGEYSYELYLVEGYLLRVYNVYNDKKVATIMYIALVLLFSLSLKRVIVRINKHIYL